MTRFGMCRAIRPDEKLKLPHEREGHRFRACGRSHKCLYRRGRAALQGRVSPLKSAWALAPVVVLLRRIAFFRKLFSRAAQGQ